jgi:lysyl-tRNA synthetase class 2
MAYNNLDFNLFYMSDINYSREVIDRIEKIKKLREMGDNPYKERYDISNPISDLSAVSQETLPNAEEAIKNPQAKYSIAGRIITFRSHGKLSFAQLQDQTGRIQICFMQDLLDKERYKFATKMLDMADFIGCKGELFITNHGETTLLITEFDILSKTMRPLPEKWHGIQDQELKYRKRYLETTTDRSTFDRFMFRAKFMQAIREYLNENNFLEIETPTLSSSASGALAKPFQTHHNALDEDFYLRIAPETYLKKAVAGGFERVYEFAKCFRNEGIDPSHLQEFTMLEYYASYWNYEDNMKFTEKLMEHLTTTLYGTTKVKFQDGEFDFKAPYPRVSMRDLIFGDCGIDIYKTETVEELRAAIKEKGIKLDETDTLARGNLIDTLYKKVSRPKIKNPIFLIGHPIDLSPLARRNDDNPSITDRFQLVVNGWEVVNAYSELIDPIDQKNRFIEQSQAKAGGDEEAMMFDYGYLEAVEHGMPPMSGWGMGIDRIVSLLTDQDNIKDVVMFPLMRPDSDEERKVQALVDDYYKDSDLKPISVKAPKTSKANSSSAFDPGFTREQAIELIEKYVNPNLQPHLYFVEAAMKQLAEFYGHAEQAELWGLVGLVHDIDWSITEPAYNDGDILAHCGPELDRILGEVNASSDLIEAVRSHYHTLELALDTDLKKALYAVDELCGFIVAVTYVRPSKKMEDVKVSSVKKKFKDKGFAAKVDRSLITTCEQNLDTPIDKFIEVTLEAMKKIAADQGL